MKEDEKIRDKNRRAPQSGGGSREDVPHRTSIKAAREAQHSHRPKTTQPEGEAKKASRPAGERVNRPAGERASRPTGERVARPTGERASRPAGERVVRPAGERASRRQESGQLDQLQERRVRRKKEELRDRRRSRKTRKENRRGFIRNGRQRREVFSKKRILTRKNQERNQERSRGKNRMRKKEKRRAI